MLPCMNLLFILFALWDIFFCLIGKPWFVVSNYSKRHGNALISQRRIEQFKYVIYFLVQARSKLFYEEIHFNGIFIVLQSSATINQLTVSARQPFACSVIDVYAVIFVGKPSIKEQLGNNADVIVALWLFKLENTQIVVLVDSPQIKIPRWKLSIIFRYGAFKQSVR